MNIMKFVDEVSYLTFHSYSMQLIPTHMRIGLKSKHMKALNPEFWPKRIAIQELLLAQISQEVSNRTLKFCRSL